METFIKADIFFFVTTIAVVVFTALASIALYYLILGLQSFKNMAKKLEAEQENAEEFVKETVERVTDSNIFNFLFPKKRKSSKK